MTPVTATVVTAVTVGLLAAAPPPEQVAIAAAVTMICLVVIERSVSPIALLLGWTVAFLIPLVLIHGLLNTQFPVSDTFYGVPIRSKGIAYAGVTGAFIASLFVVAVYWLRVKRDQFMKFLVVLGLPTALLSVAFQALSLVQQIDSRSRIIALAQRARGIDTEGNIFTRARALVPIVLPLTVTLLREARTRAAIQDYVRAQDAIHAPIAAKLMSFAELLIVSAGAGLLWLLLEQPPPLRLLQV